MLLLIDAGNTRVKWALATAATYACAGFDREELGNWSCSGAITRDAMGQLTEAWRGRQVARVVLSNVAGEDMRKQLGETIVIENVGGAPSAPGLSRSSGSARRRCWRVCATAIAIRCSWAPTALHRRSARMRCIRMKR